MNETLQILKTRRSVRAYRADQIKEEELDAILEAGSFAPSGKSMQPCTIVSLQDPELIDMAAVVDDSRGGLAQYYGAPTVVLVFADPGVRTHKLDGAAATMNMLNAAHSLGVDSCWINIPAGAYESEKGKALLCKLGLDNTLAGVASLVLGYGSGAYPNPKPRREGCIKKF